MAVFPELGIYIWSNREKAESMLERKMPTEISGQRARQLVIFSNTQCLRLLLAKREEKKQKTDKER